MLRRWLQARRLRRQALEVAADEWRARHGEFARGLAGMRSVDAYLLGDFDEQERWARIRQRIHEESTQETPREPTSTNGTPTIR